MKKPTVMRMDPTATTTIRPARQDPPRLLRYRKFLSVGSGAILSERSSALTSVTVTIIEGVINFPLAKLPGIALLREAQQTGCRLNADSPQS